MYSDDDDYHDEIGDELAERDGYPPPDYPDGIAEQAEEAWVRGDISDEQFDEGWPATGFANYDVSRFVTYENLLDKPPVLDLGVKHDPSQFARNEFTFYMEDLSRPITPGERARWKAQELRDRMWRNRLRRRYRFIRGRLNDAWGVLLHGLPEREW
jgi:hypothetical protein